MEFKMRKNSEIRTILIAGVLCLSVSSLQAESYRWKDKEGKVHYGAAVPAEYAEQPYDVLNSQGIVIEHVEDTSIPIEVIAEERVKKRQPLISDEERERQSDRLLVVQYRSEEDITNALELQIAQLGYDLRLIKQSYDSANTAINDQIALAADRQRANLPISEDQHQGIENLYTRRARDEKKLASLSRRENAIRDRFQGYLDRYRFLTSENNDEQETQDEQTDTG
jgi:hypothetical protein